MKLFFIGLVVLNVCYLLFQQMSAVDEPKATQELAAVRASDSASDSASLAADASDVSEPVLPEPVPESVAQVSLKSAQPDSQSESLPGGAAKTSGQSLLASVETPPSVSTKQSAQGPALASSSASSPTSGLRTQPASNCVIAGPFQAREDGQALVTQLANAGIDATLQPRDTTILPDYMVYVGPESTTAEARALEAKFKARQMDSHVIAAGDLQNALSLGVFSRGPLAKSLHQQLQSEGYEASISELTRNRRGYQVLTRLPPLIRAKLIESDTPMIDCPQAIAQR